MPSDSRISHKLASFIQRSDKKQRTTAPTSSTSASSSTGDAVTLSGSSRVEKRSNGKRRLLGWRSKSKEDSNSPKENRSIQGSADNSPRVSQDNQRSNRNYSQPNPLVPYIPTPSTSPSTALEQRTAPTFTATSSNPERNLAPINSLASTALETDPKRQIVKEAINKYNAALERDPVVFNSADITTTAGVPFYKAIKYTVGGKSFELWKSNNKHFNIKRIEGDRPTTPFKLESGDYPGYPTGYTTFDATFDNVPREHHQSNIRSAMFLKEPTEPSSSLRNAAKKTELDTLIALRRTMPDNLLTQVNLLQN